MRKLLLVATALLGLYSAAYAAFFMPQTYLPAAPARTQVSLTTYGGVCDGVTDDTAAFLAFRAAWQGTTPVQLNLPGNCTYLPTSGPNFWIFLGVSDLIVQGTGTPSSGIKNISGAQNVAFGGKGMVQDNSHSIRFNTASAGGSCITTKAAPSITISGAAPSIAPMATFTATSSGTTLTVSSVASGSIAIGAQIRAQSSDPRYFNTIVSQSTGPAGGAGTYVLSVSLTQASPITFVSAAASFNASVDANGVMTVSSVEDGTLTIGAPVYSLDNKYAGTGGNTKGITTIKSQLTGSAGSTGTYQLDNVDAGGAVASQAFHTAGQVRLTVNSTAGLTTGDTVPISGLVGTGALNNVVNGLKWIKVVDATHIDLFQWVFQGAYTSGGAIGGDQTGLVSVGGKVMLGGYTLQSYWSAPYSFPTNHHWFEWLTVQSKNSSTHQICFTTPLVNAYKDTWPQYNTGSVFEIDPGGPATLYAIDSTWELTHVYKDFTIDNPSFQTGAGGRTVTFNNVATTGGNCLIPSQNETYNWININGSSCNIETDKLVGTWNINSSSINILTVQSSSFNAINISNGSSIKQMSGTPKTFTADASTFHCTGCPSTSAGLSVGAIAYGSSTEAVITNTSIANSLGAAGPLQRADDATHPWSMSGGVITIPNSYSWNGCCNNTELQIRGMVPGNYAAWQGGGRTSPFTAAQIGRVFKIVDVTQDVDNTYITTSEAGGFPTGDWMFNGLSVKPHPSPKLTTSGITGGVGATWFNGCPAQSPMFSCANYTQTGGASGTTLVGGPTIWGELTSFTFTNNVPYTGAGSLSWIVPQFATFPYLKTDNTQTLIQLGVNMKLPSSCGSCTRTFTSSGATNTQAGDNFPASIPAGAVFGAGLGNSQFTANTPSDSPQVTITLRTDQHLP